MCRSTVYVKRYKACRSMWKSSQLSRKNFKESKMSSSANNDIISLKFCYRNAENKNIIFSFEFSKIKKVSDL
ncbi:unnamed protein product [Rhizophagus irregularis]|nr:unnamed protein product [Rhizophagus irregularis]